MKRYKKYWFYLLLAFSISLTVLILNDLNSPYIQIPKIVQDINSGVIGAILTTIITLILLSNQTESQENLTKSSVVYEEKLKIFNSFLETIGKCLEDGNLSAQETQKIIHSFSILRIHISAESSMKIEKAIASIDTTFFYVDENNVPNLNRYIHLYTELTNVFRFELYADQNYTSFPSFEFKNFSEILFRKRTMRLTPGNFNELVSFLRANPKIIHTLKNQNTITYKLNNEQIDSFVVFHDFIIQTIQNIAEGFSYKYEIRKYIINNENYLSIPWIEVCHNNHYFAHFGIAETKRLFFGATNSDSKTKQIASIEFYEIELISNLKSQIEKEVQLILAQKIKEKNVGD